jgi:hypothetical protein
MSCWEQKPNSFTNVDGNFRQPPIAAILLLGVRAYEFKSKYRQILLNFIMQLNQV